MVLELYPGYGKVFWGLKGCIPNLRTYFSALTEKKYDSVFARHHVKNMLRSYVLHVKFPIKGGNNPRSRNKIAHIPMDIGDIHNM